MYKRLDTDLSKPVEDRSYYIRIPIPQQGGVRKSLKVADKNILIQKRRRNSIVYN